jgi:hypothetical protein
MSLFTKRSVQNGEERKPARIWNFSEEMIVADQRSRYNNSNGGSL